MRFLFPLLLVCIGFQGIAQKLNLHGGHSHNDYHHNKPLDDALEAKLVSIEADVFPVGNKLLVGHSKDELQPNRTLSTLYLTPLFERYQQGTLDSIILLIDIKVDGEKAYRLLKKKLTAYAEMLTIYRPNNIEQKLVSVILSGNRPWSLLAEEERLAALDGRFDSISFLLGASYFPLVSTNWKTHFQWKGKGQIQADEQKQLQKMVAQCHNQNKLIRFWNTAIVQPDAANFWELFRREQIDLSGTDRPSEFRMFTKGQ